MDFDLEECTSKTPVGARCQLRVGALTPTQNAVGLDEVLWVQRVAAGVALVKLFEKRKLVTAKRSGHVLSRDEMGRWDPW